MTTLTAHNARQDMDAVHERILRAVEASEKLPEVDIDEISRVAANAYETAMNRGGSLEQAEAMALAALEDSTRDSAWMRDRAMGELTAGRWSASPRARTGREFGFDFLFAALLPTVAGALVWWLAKLQSDLAAKAAFGVFGAAFLLASIAAVIALKNVGHVRKAGGGWNEMLVHSGGAMASGFFFLLALSVFVYDQRERVNNGELEAGLERVNQAAAVTLAALKSGATVPQTQDAVTRVTAANWIKVEPNSNVKGAVLARAYLPHTMTAELRLASTSAQAPSLTSYLKSKSGEVLYADYILGTVVKADFDKVTVQVDGATTPQVIALPRGTLPPPVRSQVVAAISRADNTTVFLQPIDAVVVDLKR